MHGDDANFAIAAPTAAHLGDVDGKRVFGVRVENDDAPDVSAQPLVVSKSRRFVAWSYPKSGDPDRLTIAIDLERGECVVVDGHWEHMTWLE